MQALRGCLYGNQKLVQLSYPFYDCSMFFEFVAKQVSSGWSEALRIKMQIGAAHRAGRWAQKNQHIEAIKVCKRRFKVLERERFKSIAILQAVFTAVQQNAAMATAIGASKMQGQMVKPFMVQAQDRIVDKQSLFLSKLQSQLNDLRYSGQVGSAFAPDRNTVTVPAQYVKYAAATQPSAPPMAEAVAYPVPSHPVSHTWDDIEMMLSSGPMLFVPETFYQFCALVELVGGRANAKLSRTLCEMEEFIRSTQQKTVQWGTAPHAFANTLATSRPAAFGAFANFKFVSRQPPQRQPATSAGPVFRPQNRNNYRRQGNNTYYTTSNNHHANPTNATPATPAIDTDSTVDPNIPPIDPIEPHIDPTEPTDPTGTDTDHVDAVDMYGSCGPR